MSKIKTRETVRNVKTIDMAAIAGERMKNAFIRSKNGAENLMDDRQVTPSEYAEDKVLYAAEDSSHDAAHLAGSGVKTAANKGKEAFQRHRAEKAAEKLRDRSSTADRPEQHTTHATGQTPTAGNQTVSATEQQAASEYRATGPERPPAPQHRTATYGEHHQARPVRQGYQPVSTEGSGSTLYPDADRMVEQGWELAKKKAKRKADTAREIRPCLRNKSCTIP